MAGISVLIDVASVENAGERLLKVNADRLGRAATRVVNAVAQRGFDESRRLILSGVNLTDDYIKARMGVEPANDTSKPTAEIVAFRSGGRRPGTRPVNLRQFSVVQIQKPVRFTNDFPPIAAGEMGWNPRKPGHRLPWKKRVGAPQLGIPVEQKQAGLSIEVVRGRRKTISYAFLASANAGKVAGGQGLLVFARSKSDTKGKGKLHPMYSLSVWQMFRKQLKSVAVFIEKELDRDLSDEINAEINKVLDE